MISRQKQGGFTLIEVLVSMLILLIGLLGTASMQLVSMQANQNAYIRSQATYIAGEFLDRIRSNPEGHRAGQYDSITLATASDVPTSPNCVALAAGCSPANMVNHDIREWAGHFFNLNGQVGYKPTIPGGSATVTRDVATDEYTVTVFWLEKDWTQDVDGNAVRGDSISRSVELRTVVR